MFLNDLKNLNFQLQSVFNPPGAFIHDFCWCLALTNFKDLAVMTSREEKNQMQFSHFEDHFIKHCNPNRWGGKIFPKTVCSF